MTREEYLNRLNDLTHQLKMLKDEYITSNNCIPKGNYVIVSYDNKEARYYLKDYKIIDGYIKPIFNYCDTNGKRCAAYLTRDEFPGNITIRLA